MPRWLLIVAVVVALVAAATTIASTAWNRATARAVARMHGTPTGGTDTSRYGRGDLAGLPHPVARYFAFALSDGQPLARRARLTQEGTFAMRRDAWSSFSAVEYFRIGQAPGFVWDARIRIVPLVVARVRDTYHAGDGGILGRIDALIPVVDQRGTPEMAAGGLLRYLAESVWIPTALLPRSGVHWSAIDDSTARATLTDRATTVSMDVYFASSGEITRITAQRYRDVAGKAVLTPWIGRYQNYARSNGMMVPMRSEVGWMLPDGWFPYWRGTIVSADLDTL